MSISAWNDDFTVDHVTAGDYTVEPFISGPASAFGYTVLAGKLSIADGQALSVLDKRAPITGTAWKKIIIAAKGYFPNDVPSSGGGVSQIAIGVSAGIGLHPGVQETTYEPGAGYRSALTGDVGYFGAMISSNMFAAGMADVFTDEYRDLLTGMQLPTDTEFTATLELFATGDFTLTLTTPATLTRRALKRVLSTVLPTILPDTIDETTPYFAMNLGAPPLNLDLRSRVVYPGFAIAMTGQDAWLTGFSYEILYDAVPFDGGLLPGEITAGQGEGGIVRNRATVGAGLAGLGGAFG